MPKRKEPSEDERTRLAAAARGQLVKGLMNGDVRPQWRFTTETVILLDGKEYSLSLVMEERHGSNRPGLVG